MRIIDHGALTGYISMNRSWAGYDFEDYYRAGQIAMGLLNEDLEVDLETEYLPEAGRKIGGLVDDHGIAQIARDLTGAEQKIKDELEGKAEEENDAIDKENAVKAFQVVSGDMFSRAGEPVLRITQKGFSFSKNCTYKLHKVTHVEMLFNPVERMIIIRPCKPDHPNAIVWDSKYKSAVPLSKVIYNSMGWDTDYSFSIPCQVIRNTNLSPSQRTVLVFDLDNYIGRTSSGKDEVIVPAKETEEVVNEQDEAKSYYYPPDEDEPQEIRDIEEKFQQAVDLNSKLFGKPVFQYEPSIREFSADISDGEWDLLAPARPLDISHTVDADSVDNLLNEIMDDPPVLPEQTQDYTNTPIDISVDSKEAQ